LATHIIKKVDQHPAPLGRAITPNAKGPLRILPRATGGLSPGKKAVPLDRERRNFTAEVQQALGGAILSGEYQGVLPTEDELSAEHGVSRTVIREAVKMLTAKGLLRTKRRAGTTVQPPAAWNFLDADVMRWQLQRGFSPELLRHFNQLRRAVEPKAAFLAARDQGDPSGAIRAAYLRLRITAKTGEELAKAETAFHCAVLDASANPFFRQFRETVATGHRASGSFDGHSTSRGASVLAYAQVCNAITRRDPDRAQAAMADIVEQSIADIEGGMYREQADLSPGKAARLGN
jgi:DNA-binding FadR family transcriptional regulator